MRRNRLVALTLALCLVGGLSALCQASVHPAFLPPGAGKALEVYAPGNPAMRESIEPPEGRTPLLFDGRICPTDLWDEALDQDVSNTEHIFGTWAPPWSVTMWVKYDDHFIYFAFDNLNDLEPGDYDQVGLYIDDNGDGQFPPMGDDSEGVYWISFFTSGVQVYRAPMYEGGVQGQVEEIQNVRADICTGESGQLQCEIGIPWGDDLEDLNTSVGEEFGCWLYVMHYDGLEELYHGVWPATEMWWDPGYYNGVLRSFGPSLPKPDVWLKDCTADTGAEPSWNPPACSLCPWPWSSPDIWVGDSTGTNRGKSAYANYNNKVYCEVRNRGTVAAAQVTATFGYTKDPDIHLQTCNDTCVTWFGSTTVTNVAANGSKIAGPVTWNPPSGHWCLVVYLDTATNLDKHFSCWPWSDNNVAARNYWVTTKDTGGRGQWEQEFLVGNSMCTEGMVSVEVDRSELPEGWEASIDVPEHPARFQMAPEGVITPTLHVTSPPDEEPGTIGYVTVIEYIYNSCNGALVDQTGGFTVGVTASPIDVSQFEADEAVVPQSGTLGFTISAQNETPQAQTFDVWFDVGLPNGNEYARNPVMSFDSITIGPSASKTVHLTQEIPGGAPVGRYVYILKIGDRETDTVWNEEYFTFDVTPSVLGMGGVGLGPETLDWAMSGSTIRAAW